MQSTEGWIANWADGKTGWHRENLNVMLAKHGDKLIADQSNCRVFVPLCGKTVDMKWFLDQGHSVVGVDVATQPLKEFFTDQGIEYNIETVPQLPGAIAYVSKDSKITLYEADLFSMTKDVIGQFDCIWDRGSLVAINKPDRLKYVSTMTPLMAANSRYLLCVYDYDSTKATGPPHNFSDSDVTELYESSCKVEKLDVVIHDTPRFENCTQTVFLMKPK